MGSHHEIRKSMRFVKRTASYLLLLTLLLQVFSVAPAFAEEAPSLPQASTVTVEIPDSEKQVFDLFQDIKNIIMQFYPEEVDEDKLNEGAIRGLFEALGDPYSEYFNQEEFESLSQSLEGEFSGIGVTLQLVNGNTTVVSVFKDSPAERAGIKAGDIIVEVDGHDLRGKAPSDASELLRGKVGTTVVVTVNRPSLGQDLVFTLRRAVITLHTIDMKDLGDGLFYLDVDQFTSTTGKNLSVIMTALRAA
ncbi:MAG TPA: PDZ domain-containing protein, partial [Bacillota bacterium]|nr:PDZ domain-containing protein [Bacillota bacterium]